jgi:hypothetical protein
MRSVIGWLGGKKSLITSLSTLLLAQACGGEPQERPDPYVEKTSNQTVLELNEPCASPTEGCPCAEPGVIADCGQVTVKVDDYETCYEGSRLCDATGVWGACEPDQIVAERSQ